MEEIISTHSSVAECAVVGADDELKGKTGSNHGVTHAEFLDSLYSLDLK